MPRKMPKKIHFIIIFFLIFLSLSFTSFPDNNIVIKEIVIEGNHTVKTDEILSKLESKVGDPYNQQTVSRDIKNISKLGYFESVEALDDKIQEGILIFKVKENAVLNNIYITGANFVKTKDIYDKVNYLKGKIYTIDTENKIKEAVLKLYKEKGYYSTTVDIEIIKLQDNLIDAAIKINENLKILVKKVRFVGNNSIASFRLRWIISTKGSKLFIKNYFDQLEFDNDIERVAGFYQSLGFFDIKVTKLEPISNERGKWIIPRINIVEGKRYRLINVEPDGNTLFSDREILENYSHLTGKFFNGKRFYQALLKTKDLYGAEGFVLCEINTIKENINPEASTFDIRLKIDENKRIYVNAYVLNREQIPEYPDENTLDKIANKVSPSPNNDIIKKEIILKPKGEEIIYGGQKKQSDGVYRSTTEKRSIERLKKLRFFNNDELTVSRESTDNPEKLNAVFNLKDEATGRFGFGIGVGDERGLYGFVGLTERNLFGTGNVLSATVYGGTRAFEFNINYLDRYFKDTLYSFNVDLYNDFIDRKGYEERRVGTRLKLSKPVNEYVDVFGQLRLDYVMLDADDKDDISHKLREDLSDYPVATVKFGIEEDRTDDPIWPTKGFKRNIDAEIGYADGFLMKVNTGYSFFKSIKKNLIYALNAELGMSPLDADKFGISERYFLGGSNTIRGFKYRGIGPKDSKDEDVAIGGATRLIINNELRYPIYDKLKGLVFMDIGMLDEEAFSLSSPRVSIGTGFRFDIPQASLKLDFALPLVKKSYDDTEYVHFTIGTGLFF